MRIHAYQYDIKKPLNDEKIYLNSRKLPKKLPHYC